MKPDFLFNLPTGDVIYDIETYPNTFTFYAVHTLTKQEWSFEISNRMDHSKLLRLFMKKLFQMKCRMVGFNNIGFDYPVIHFIYLNPNVKAKQIYRKAMSIIENPDDKFIHIIWDSNQIVPQVDLFKINHFDNLARATSLKVLEFNMRSTSIQDLPFQVGTDLIDNQVTELIRYNRHDVLETLKFYEKSLDKIKFREELTEKYGKNFINHNDTKIGKDYFIMRLEENNPGSCYKVINGKRRIVQTPREEIHIKDIILPYVTFDHPELNRVLSFLKGTVITETKGFLKDLTCNIDEFELKFGTGGIHGSVENKAIRDEEGYIIEDIDVASYYPNLSISNEFHPEHLGKLFCEIYKDVYEQRKNYEKGTSENAMLKLALNGVYGDSNNEYSPFYDPKYTMSITINGQLLLCMLVEMLLQPIDNFKIQLIQVNTDGLTIKYNEKFKGCISERIKNWEKLTGLTLESNTYKRMYIRDVNNYIAEYEDGTVKRKGAYEHEREWHQNQSAMVVPKAAEAYLLHGEDYKKFIKTHENNFDFLLRTKIPRSSFLEYGGERTQNITRYYISTDGDILEKVMPPKGKERSYKRKNGITNSLFQEVTKEIGDNWDERVHTKSKTKYETRRIGIHTGWTVQLCNDITHTTFTDIDYNYYIQETEKLVKSMT